jgi:hypothetical protein
MDYKIEVTTPDGVLRYRTFRPSPEAITSVLLDELRLDPEPGTTMTVEVSAVYLSPPRKAML